VDALVVSREVVPRAHRLNTYKTLARWLARLLPPLWPLLAWLVAGLHSYALLVVPTIGEQPGAAKLSSTALRERDAAAAVAQLADGCQRQ
jgi:hypothetical protein